MREIGRRFVRLAVGTPVALAVALAGAAAGCGGDGSSAEVPQEEGARTTQAATETGGAATGGGEMAAGAVAQELPAGVTAAMIDEGKKVYEGSGICVTCHGATGQGVPNLGANLTDSEWLHSDGSYEAIVKTVTEGVSAEKSSSGVPMPPKGGSTISEAQVKAVAAYVWSLSHGGS